MMSESITPQCAVRSSLASTRGQRRRGSVVKVRLGVLVSLPQGRKSAVLLLAFAACHDDFEDLFRDRAVADGAVDGGAEAGSLACVDADVSAACATKECAGSTCNYSCRTCGCTCPPAKCPDGPGAITACSASCSASTRCNVTCDNTSSCNFACSGCVGVYVCKGHTETCDVTVETGSDVQVTCESSGACNMNCRGGSSCLLSCSDNSPSCDLKSDGSTVNCGPRKFACNRSCT